MNLRNFSSLFDIRVFGKQAEACSEHLTEGRGVRIVGRLKQELVGDDGDVRSNVFIIAEHVEFKPKKSV